MLENDRERSRVDAHRRLLILGGATALLYGAIGSRLFYLQVLKGGVYQDMAENNRLSFQPVPAPRGRIFDRNGEILVDNRPDYRLMAVPELCGGLPELLERLQPLLEFSPKEIQIILRQAQKQRAFLPLKIKSHLNWEELSKLEVRIHTFPGCLIQIQSQRYYPSDSLSAHILGYLGEMSEDDKRYFSQMRFRSGDFVGKTGVERTMETQLRGVEGVVELEVNAVGRIVRELRQTPPQPGQDLYLSLDSGLQRHAEEALAATERNGAVVVIHARTGEVLAMASHPTYNPNQFIVGLTNQQWRHLALGSGKPLINKGIQGQYPPGSTFKIVVALAALAEGKLNPNEFYSCGGSISRVNHTFHCWKKNGHGSVNLTQAIAQSCDVYFYKVGEKIGIDVIERYARLLGLGEVSGLGLDGERKGLIPGRSWKRTIKHQGWYPGETLITAIGQGWVSATPLQLACMIATVANGGTLFQPTLLRCKPGERAVVRRQLHVQPSHWAMVRAGLEEVVNGPRGTARTVAPKSVRAAGKTGTSQVVRQRRREDGGAIKATAVNQQDHALFVCYAPTDAPELAIAVVVEHGEHGSSTAAPVASRIMDYYFTRHNDSQEMAPSTEEPGT